VILYRWQGEQPNFGDELNTVLWPRLLPDFFDDNPDTRFLGIGSVLDGRHPGWPLKLVAGSGYGGYERKAAIDQNWVIHWVRGPRTAAAMGLPHTLGLGDPAVLLPLALDQSANQPHEIGFMPHFETIARGGWHRAAAIAGITLIDPRDPPLTVLAAIRRCKLLLSEALHGVIVADAMRVPWIAMRPLAAIHRAKWRDWAETMTLSIRPQLLPASSVTEWVGVQRLVAPHPIRCLLNANGAFLDRLGSQRMIERAAVALRRAAAADPQLSQAAALDRCQGRMMEALTVLRRQPMTGAPFRGSMARERSGLHPRDDSAYALKTIG
jgi:succinoglycan biosynthesis protein ExoV